MERTDTLPLWIGAIVLVVLVGGYFYFAGRAAPAEGEGTVYFTISDAAADIRNVSEVAMTVNKVELHSASEGWVTVSSAPRTFNLLALKASGKAELAGEANVAAGAYDQVRATISRVEVRTTNAGNRAAILVSNTITIPGRVVVEAGESSHADFDVQTSDSLYMATGGEYVFAPVVVFQSRHDTEVTTGSDRSVTVSGGVTDANVTIGTDISGNVHIGSRLSPNLQIQVVNGSASAMGTSTGSGSGLIQIQVGASGSAGGSATTSNQNNTGTTTGGARGSGSGNVNVGL